MRINYCWKENNKSLSRSPVKSDFQVRTDCKTPGEAAKKFFREWTAKNSGYRITSIEDGFNVFKPKKYAQKNWK